MNTNKHALLAKGLTTLFWLKILSVAANFLTMEQTSASPSAVYQAGQWIAIACTLAYGAVLFRLSTVCGRYFTAGVGNFLAAAVALLVGFVLEENTVLTYALPIALITPAIGLISVYHELKGHREVLHGVDDGMAAKWQRLWRWYIGLLAASMLLPLLAAGLAQLAVMLLSAVSVALAVVGIAAFVYLYQTAKIFRSKE